MIGGLWELVTRLRTVLDTGSMARRGEGVTVVLVLRASVLRESQPHSNWACGDNYQIQSECRSLYHRFLSFKLCGSNPIMWTK